MTNEELDHLSQLEAELQSLKAKNAAMREALEDCERWIRFTPPPGFVHRAEEQERCIAKSLKALSATPPSSYVNREAVMPLVYALNGFMWLGNNLHNITEDPVRFGEYYKAAMSDAERALTTARELGFFK